MKRIEYGEYVITQGENHHVMIAHNGDMVMHVQCEKPMTDDELLSMVGFYETFVSGDFCPDCSADMVKVVGA